mmetsp:Transcript_37342/g.123186  ORF Transcript_37342/g.123186 Transcript_37342/m.123186 type:complete len:345 (-) Transcript_37342:203-1237(-)
MSSREQIGRFEVNLDRLLGSGGFGQVFRAVDQTASPPLYVAAKRGRVADLRREAQILELVAGHPAIIELHGFVEDPRPGGRAFLFLEICSGGELFDRLIDSGCLSERAARPFARNIAEALRHCLSRGIAHRDVKLENVMLSAEDPSALKLIDFGLACTVPLAPDGSLKPVLLYDCVGSKSYMAPELFFASAGYHAPPVDCWAYGVLVFSLLAGFFPFEEATASDWRYAKLAQSVANGVGPCDAIFRMYNRSCPFSPAAREFCDALLTIDATARATIEQCLNHTWLTPPPSTATARGAYLDDDVVYRTAERALAAGEEEGLVAPPPPDGAPRLMRQTARVLCAPP